MKKSRYALLTVTVALYLPTASFTGAPYPLNVFDDQPVCRPQTAPCVNGFAEQPSGYGEVAGASGRVRDPSPFRQTDWSWSSTFLPDASVMVMCRNFPSPEKSVTRPFGRTRAGFPLTYCFATTGDLYAARVARTSIGALPATTWVPRSRSTP